MANFEQLAIGGLDYFSETEPTGADEEEVWLQYTPTKKYNYNPTNGTGATKEFEVSDVYYTAISATSDFVVFARDSDQNSLVAADRFDGSEDYSHDLHSGYILSIDATRDVVYSGDSDGNIISTDASTWTQNWKINVGDRVKALSYSNGVLYANVEYYNVKAIDIGTQEELWTHSLHSTDISDISASDGVVASSSTNASTSSNSKVVLSDASDGSQIWEHSLHTGRIGSVCVSDGVVASGGVYDSSYDVIAVDVSDASELWTNTFHQYYVGSIDNSNGAFYSSGTDLQAIEISTGNTIWSKNTTYSDHYHCEFEGYIYTISDNNSFAFSIDGISGTFEMTGIENSNVNIYYNGTWTPHQ
jgi:outer membrane protein assembly factor BamB